MLFPDGSDTEKDINMLSREDFFMIMIKQMRHQGAYIVDIATQIAHRQTVSALFVSAGA